MFADIPIVERPSSRRVYVSALAGIMIAGALAPIAMVLVDFAKFPYRARNPEQLLQALAFVTLGFFGGAALTGAVGVVILFTCRIVESAGDFFDGRSALAAAGGGWTGCITFLTVAGIDPQSALSDREIYALAVLATLAGLIGAGLPAVLVQRRQDMEFGLDYLEVAPKISLRQILVLTSVVAICTAIVMSSQVPAGTGYAVVLSAIVQLVAISGFAFVTRWRRWRALRDW
jgi:hypothetical protein